MAFDAGRLRHRITIQSPVHTQNPDTGEIVVTWADLGKAWAAIEPLSASEFIQSAATQSKVVARITIRHRPGLTADMRLIHNGTIYNPAGYLADKDSGLEYITIPVSTGVSDSGQ